MRQEYIDKINEAQFVLVGIGSEFEKCFYKRETRAVEALRELLKLLKDKNYYVVSTCMNDILLEAGFPRERITSPCGTLEMKQCPNGCEGGLQFLSDAEKQLLSEAEGMEDSLELGVCSVCGKKLVLNNVNTENYDESIYLPSWQNYTKWLQGTLNRKICILELGVYWLFPTIIRLPFEKVALYNQKADFIRVNEKLYYMAEELKDKGISIEKNAIDWLLEKDI